MTQIYMYQGAGQYFICGLPDYIEGIDDVPSRNVVDHGVNRYGDLFLDFLTDVNCCVLNGRNYQMNDLTSSNATVVDYCVNMICYTCMITFL